MPALRASFYWLSLLRNLQCLRPGSGKLPPEKWLRLTDRSITTRDLLGIPSSSQAVRLDHPRRTIVRVDLLGTVDARHNTVAYGVRVASQPPSRPSGHINPSEGSRRFLETFLAAL